MRSFKITHFQKHVIDIVMIPFDNSSLLNNIIKINTLLTQNMNLEILVLVYMPLLVFLPTTNRYASLLQKKLLVKRPVTAKKTSNG
jgi:hypothetical protein